MDATKLLAQDHDKVRQLFSEFRDAAEQSDHERMEQLCDTIFEELEVHTEIEEQIFYPEIRGIDDLHDTVAEGVEEHHVVDVLMNEVRELTPDSGEEFVAKMLVLIENVEHHAEEEESEMFPEVRRHIGSEGLEDLGRRLEELKQQLTDRGDGQTTTLDLRDEAMKTDGATKEELYEKAKELGIQGRSAMTKAELADAITQNS